MDTTTIVLGGVALFLVGIAFLRDRNLPFEGLLVAGQTLWRNLPILLLGFTIAGLVQVLIPRALISNLLGVDSGVKGVLLVCLAVLFLVHHMLFSPWPPVSTRPERVWVRSSAFLPPGHCGR